MWDLDHSRLPIVMGCSPDCNIIIKDRHVRRQHAQIRRGRSCGRLVLEPLTAGCFVNERRLSVGEACELFHGDALTFCTKDGGFYPKPAYLYAETGSRSGGSGLRSGASLVPFAP